MYITFAPTALCAALGCEGPPRWLNSFANGANGAVGTVAYARSGVERACAEAVSGCDWLMVAERGAVELPRAPAAAAAAADDDEDKGKDKEDIGEGSRAIGGVVDGPNGETVSEGEK